MLFSCSRESSRSLTDCLCYTMGLSGLAMAQAAGGCLTFWGASPLLATRPLTNSYGVWGRVCTQSRQETESGLLTSGAAFRPNPSFVPKNLKSSLRSRVIRFDAFCPAPQPFNSCSCLRVGYVCETFSGRVHVRNWRRVIPLESSRGLCLYLLDKGYNNVTIYITMKIM